MLDGPDPRANDSREREGADPRDEGRLEPQDVFTRGLNLPHGLEREHVRLREDDYRLRGSETRALATIGAFRVVPANDLRDDRGRPGTLRRGDLEHLRIQGLIQPVAPLDRGERTVLVTLTERGRELLEKHRSPGRGASQSYYSGAVKARELSHDGQLYRAYQRVAERLESAGSRIERVVLDYELKREYQRFLQDGNRGRPDADGRPTRSRDEIKCWAEDHRLPMRDGSVQFPDFRVEYEQPDGRPDVEDVEVTTIHYRGAHASGRVASGFTRFRGTATRVGGKARGGAAPFDPRSAEELLS
jgi:DNA-binding MarR family transcriptional regulator